MPREPFGLFDYDLLQVPAVTVDDQAVEAADVLAVACFDTSAEVKICRQVGSHAGIVSYSARGLAVTPGVKVGRIQVGTGNRAVHASSCALPVSSRPHAAEFPSSWRFVSTETGLPNTD